MAPWRDFGPLGGMLGPARAAITRAWRDLARVAGDLWRRVRRQPRSTVVRTGTAEAVVMGLDARARVTHGPIDPSSLAAAVVELDRRIRLLVDRLADVQEFGQDEAKAWRAAL